MTGLDPVRVEGSRVMGGFGQSEVTPHHQPRLTPTWVWLQAGNGACQGKDARIWQVRWGTVGRGGDILRPSLLVGLPAAGGYHCNGRR